MTSRIHVNSHDKVPSVVLKGHMPAYKSVHTVFVNVAMQEYLKRRYASYIARSHLDAQPDLRPDSMGYSPVRGREDEHGNSWEQLRPSTYFLKQSESKKGRYDKYLSNRKSRAAKDVFPRVQAMKGNHLSGDGMNIRTGRLLAANFPGPIINGVLIRTADQNITIKGLNLHFDTDNVPHSLSVEDSRRPIVPRGMDEVWMQEAVEIALVEAQNEWDRLKERQKQRNKLRRLRRRIGRRNR